MSAATTGSVATATSFDRTVGTVHAMLCDAMRWQAASALTGTRTTPSAKSTAAPTHGEAQQLTLKCEADVLAIYAIQHIRVVT